MKAWGGHHLFAASPVLVLAFWFPWLAAVNAAFWFGKELGEATGRAGSTKMAFAMWCSAKTKHWPGGIWEHWDWVTPSIAGVVVWV